jgi:glucose/arabinose dehydrogenase
MSTTSRPRPHRLFAALFACVSILVSACGGGNGTGARDGGDGGGDPLPPDPPGEPQLTTARVFPSLPNFDAPVLALQAPGDPSEWYVVEQAGRVHSFDNEPSVATTHTVLDLRSRVTSGGEAGLLGMAFHPAYPADPRAYLSYTTTVDGALVSRIVEVRTRDGGNTLDPATERLLLTVPQPARNHNGGHIAFGPTDGLLYAGFGDGGGAGDPSAPIGNGQRLTTLLGKILRIDVEVPAGDGGPAYGIPPGNPFAANGRCSGGSGDAPCAEIFAWGFRNPWRWSFDRATGEFWVADVGEGSREEVNRIDAGGNYGWRCFEGTQAFNSDCGQNSGTSLPPVAEYDHSAGRSVTGGYVYRGDEFDGLAGRYVFGDFISGRLWQLPASVQPTRTVAAAEAVETGLSLVSFAEDVAGELYALDYAGALHRVRIAAGTP